MAYYPGDIPENADKMLFAEDLIYWLLINRWSVSPQILLRTHVSNNSLHNYREFIHNAFDTCMKGAISFIDDFLASSISADFASMSNENRLNVEAFVEYASNYHGRYFPDGFDPTRFLNYCGRLANMAGYFYVRGMENVLPLAADFIVRAFPQGDMYHNGGWDTLKEAAHKLERMGIDCDNELTPRHSSDSSDSSYLTDSSCAHSDVDEN